MLPHALLSVVENHSCFSGCYDSCQDIEAIVDVRQGPETTYHLQCKDCLSFHVGILARHLPVGMDASSLAREVTEHVRNVRGYSWSIGGYHVGPASLWLSAAYYPCGVVLVNSERNTPSKKPVDALIEGYQLGIIPANDSAMFDPANYRTYNVYLDMSKSIGVVNSVADILTSPRCSQVSRSGFQKVAVLEFLPIVQSQTHSTPSLLSTNSISVQPSVSSGTLITPASTTTNEASGQKLSSSKKLSIGEFCPRCGAEVKERPSLYETFVGCLC